MPAPAPPRARRRFAARVSPTRRYAASAKARVARPVASVWSPMRRRTAAASAVGEPGLYQQRVVFMPQNLAQRGQIGRHDGTACREVLEELERRGVTLGGVRRCVGQYQHMGRASSATDRCRREPARERHPIADAFLAREAVEPHVIGLSRLPADDACLHVRKFRQRVQQHVDALPRVKVAGVGDRERGQRRWRLERARRDRGARHRESPPHWDAPRNGPRAPADARGSA